ncbi:carbohydrate-binding family 9-like protein [bacterium]|nr:carbohydrate-binding family 9-like protein [bacterium]
MKRDLTVSCSLLLLSLLFVFNTSAEFPVPQIPFEFRTATAPSVIDSLTIDGRGDEQTWQQIPWSDPFVDIRGFDYNPAPRHETRIKMAWDDEYFYVLAWLEEPHLWATYDQHDMVIYHENDFEVFIDPDGDLHNYLELEINALGTTWDLMLTKPYRDNGRAIDSWEIPGLKSAIHLDGTLNNPSDTDTGWGVELAIPWDVINEVDNREHSPGQTSPLDLRVNFSRVQWQLEVVDGQYVKRTDPDTGDPLPEDNWVWSAQGLIAMHYPERWGFVGLAQTTVQPDQFWRQSTAPLREMALSVYYAQKRFHEENDKYTSDLTALSLPETVPYTQIEWPPEITVVREGYLVDLYDSFERRGLRIREDGWLQYLPYHTQYNFKPVKGVRSR